MTDERPERKKPRVWTGRSWSTRAVPRLYLDDIEDIYVVMRDYVPHSPWYQVEQKYYAEGIPIELPPPEPPEPPKLPEPPKPVEAWIEMETDEHIIRSLPELHALRRKAVPEFKMGVGLYDLELWCSKWRIKVSTNGDDPPSVAAFDTIRDIVLKRRSPLLHVLFNALFVPIVGGTYVLLVLLGAFFKSNALAYLTLPFAVLTWAFLVCFNFVWDRRKDVVVLRTRMEAPTFWEEHGRDVIKGSLISLIPLAVAAVVAWLAGLF